MKHINNSFKELNKQKKEGKDESALNSKHYSIF